LAIIIPWSGGMDSTLLAYQEALENPKEMINLVAIIDKANTHYAFEQEAKARVKILKELKYLKNIQYFEITVNTSLSEGNWTLPLWLCYIAPIISDKDIVKFAYLSSDGIDFFDKRDIMIKTFTSIMELRGISANIEFPYQYKTKGYVIEELKKLKRLYRLTYFCGDPSKKGKPCGKCMKCMSVKRWTKYPDKGVNT